MTLPLLNSVRAYQVGSDVGRGIRAVADRSDHWGPSVLTFAPQCC
jgi:hypothetical protein